MATKFIQADGKIADSVQPTNSTTYVAGTVFTPSETKAPATSDVNSIVVYDNFDGSFHNLKNVGGATIDSNGVVNSEVTFNNLIDQSTAGETQPIVVNPGDTNIVIDLALGTTIRLVHDENVTITFTNMPASHVTVVVIDRRKANNTNPVTISFNHVLKTEGRQKLTLTNTANARDIITLYIKDGVIYTRSPVPNFTQSTGTITTMSTYKSTLPDPKIARAGDPNTIVSMTSAGYFITTDVQWDGTTFLNAVNSKKNKFALSYFPFEQKTASIDDPLNLDVTNGIFAELILDANVATFDITNLPLPNLTVYTIFVKHDNTTNVYDINWSSDYKYDTRPALTQAADAEDILIIKTLDGNNKVVHCFQNFGTPL